MNLLQNWFKKPQLPDDAVFIAKANHSSIDFFLNGKSKEDIMNLLLSLTLGQYIEVCLDNCENKYPGFIEEYNTVLESIETQMQNNRKGNYISPLD